MTDPRPALHAAILADPGDLAARHAYADACEEHGDDARAAFVRASLAGDHAGASCSLDPLTYQILLDHLEDQGIPVEGLRGAGWTRSNWAIYHMLEGEP